MMKKDDGGARLIRGALIFTFGVSLAANVGHTLLADSVIPVAFRMVGAVIWPILVLLGVDILVKVAWDLLHGRRGVRGLARLLILIPGIPAAITSYEHMHAVLLAMGERTFIAAIGPGAVDVMMIGCTITLVLLKRSRRTAPLEADMAMSDEQMAAIVEQWAPAPVETAEVAAVAAPVETVAIESAPRSARPAKAEQEKAIRMMLEGESDAAVEHGYMSKSTLRTYEKVSRLLRNDPPGEIGAKVDGRSVRPEFVAIIRDHMNRERAR